MLEAEWNKTYKGEALYAIKALQFSLDIHGTMRIILASFTYDVDQSTASVYTDMWYSTVGVGQYHDITLWLQISGLYDIYKPVVTP